jgi:asparagine synthase (glutamine-hydrolysing)
MRSDDAEATLGAMCGAIRHRGPNDEGHFVADGVGLGMRRLSIIDVAGGDQPIGNEDGSVQVVFNGEIYNHNELRRDLMAAGHVFRTHCDTETLVHLYEEHGDRMVEQLRGMFAFAIWDLRQERLLIARDRLGQKPLSYWEADGGLAFCSELRSLLALDRFPARIDREAVGAFLSLGYVPDPQSIFTGVRKLPPGHLMTWSRAEGVRVERYWSPVRPEIRIDEQEAVLEIRRLLESAVSSHLESEVPLGAFLSGGLDSSTVVALMARAGGRQVRTFAIGFDEGSFNEAPHAAAVARALGTDHTELIVRPDVESLFDGLVAAFDEPFADSSAVPTYLVAQLAKRQVTVALSGDGGDELFGGYTRYAQTLARRELPAPARAVLRGVAGALPHMVPGRNRLYDMGRTREGQYANTVAFPAGYSEGGVMQADIAGRVGSLDGLLRGQFEESRDRDFGTQMTMVDLLTYLPGDILTKVDRTSMAVSLEARVPLLDHPLVEFAASLPSELKYRDGRGKHVFRQAITPIVPQIVLDKPKQGFAVPLARWFRGPLRHHVERLSEPTSPIYEFVRPDAVRRLASEHQMRRRDHSMQLWRILVLDLWLTHLGAGRLSTATDDLSIAAAGAS